MRRRVLLLTAFALSVPVPAFALSGHEPVGTDAAPEPATLAVSVTLDRCGIVGAEVLCKLDVTYDSVAGASSHTATVTRADGSVIDYGAIAPGATSLWVGYAGDGSYAVEVSAYGEPDEPGGAAPLIARDEGSSDEAPAEAQERSEREEPAEPESEAGDDDDFDVPADGSQSADEPDSPTGEAGEGTGAGGEQGGEPPAPSCLEAEASEATIGESQPQPQKPSPSAHGSSSTEDPTDC